jgi:hypothetical protein
MLSHPGGAADMLRYLEAVFLWCVRLGNAALPELTAGVKNTAALVLAKDTATTFAKAAGIPEGLFAAMKSL